MDMEKIMAYVEKIAENLEGLVCAIGCDSMPSDGAIYVDGEQKVNYISTREALRILDGFGNNSASVMIGKSDYILIYMTCPTMVVIIVDSTTAIKIRIEVTFWDSSSFNANVR